MAETKTTPGAGDVRAFLDAVPNARRREDALVVLDLMRRVTGTEPVMWGPSMVGFGAKHYRYESGREGDTFVVGFSPRSSALTVYGVHDGYEDPSGAELADLGPHTTGKGCLYLKTLDGVDLAVLERLLDRAWRRSGSADR